MIILLSDEYLTIKPSLSNKVEENEKSAKRFFEIVAHIPLELEMKICKMIYNSEGEFYLSNETEKYLKLCLKLHFPN